MQSFFSLFLVFPLIFTSCFLIHFQTLIQSVWICQNFGHKPSKFACKKRLSFSRDRQAAFTAWDSGRCCTGMCWELKFLLNWSSVADHGKLGLRLQWPPLSDLVSYPASDSNFLWRLGKVASKHCLCRKGCRLQYVSILNIFQFWNEASEKRVHKQEKMWRIRICMWLPTFLWLLPELMLHSTFLILKLR